MTEKQQKSATWSKYSNVDQEGDPKAFVKHMNTLRGMEAIKAYKQETFALLQIQADACILEVGCGPGTDAQELAEIVGPKGRIVAVDKSETMIASAQDRTRDLRLPLEYQVGDIYELDFEDDVFDGCRADRVFHHLDKPEDALAELVRVARPGARIVLAEPDFDSVLIDSPNKTVTRKVIQQRSDLYPNGWCGRQLPGLFRKVGLTNLNISSKVITSDDFDIADKQFFGLRDAAEILQEAGDLSIQQVEDWLTQLAQASQDGLFFCAVSLFIVSGQKAR